MMRKIAESASAWAEDLAADAVSVAIATEVSAVVQAGVLVAGTACTADTSKSQKERLNERKSFLQSRLEAIEKQLEDL